MTSKSQTQLDRERKARINAPSFDPKYFGEGGPMFTYVGNSSHNSPAFKKGHERIFGKQDMFKNLKKEE